MAAGAVDNLNIQLQAQANQAVGSIDVLITRLTKLNSSLNYTNRSGLTGVANGVSKLGTAMQGMKSVGTADFTRLANNITKIASLDSKSIQRASSAIGQIAKSLGSLNSVSVSGTSKQVAELANGISRLGYKSSTKAIENIPKLATAMNQLMSTLSKAPRVSQNLINMTNALANLARTGASSGKAASSVSKSLNAYTLSANRATKSSLSLAAVIGKVYASYWILFRLFRGIGKSITIASDLVEVQNVVDTVFGDMTWKVEQYADTAIEQLGMSELAFKQYSSRFQAMGTAMGIDSSAVGQANKFLSEQTNGYVEMSDSMADVSLNLTRLAADMASFYNVDQSAVAEDLEAIFTGQTRPLRTYGLDLTQATLSEWAMKQGLDANIESMSQMEKTMLRYQYVLANTTAAQGDFIRTQDTWANQVRILQERIKQWASVMGTGFIAAFKPFVQTLNRVMGHVTQFTENVLNALGQIFGWKFEISSGGMTDDLEDSLEGTDDATGDAAGNAGDLSGNLGEAAENAKKLYSTVLGIDELNINNPDTGTPGSSGSGGSSPSGGSGGGSGSGSGTDGGGLTTVMTRNDAILKAYESSIDTLYKLGEYIGDTLTNVMNGIDWDSVYQGARNFGKGLADFINGLISPELFGATGRTIAGALNAAIYAALSFGQTFDFYDYGVSIATGINEFFRTFDFAALAETLNVWVDGLIETIAGFLKTITWEDILKAAGEFLGNLEIDTVGVIIGALVIKNTTAALSSMFSSAISGFLATNGISIGKVSIGLSLAAATFVLAGSENDIASKIGAPITAFLSAYTFTGSITVSLAVSLVLATLEADIKDVVFMDNILEALYGYVGDNDAIQASKNMPEITIPQAVKIIFNMASDEKGVDVLKQVPFEITELLSGVFQKAFKDFISSAKKQVEKFIDLFKSLPTKIGYYLGILVGEFIKIPIKLGSAISSFVTETLPEWISNISDFFTGYMPNLIEDISENFRQLPDKIGEAISSFVTETLPEFGENIVEFFKSIPEKIGNIFEKKSGDNSGGFLSGFVQGVSDSLNIDLAGVISSFGEKAGTLFSNARKNIENAFLPIVSWFSGKYESIKNIFSSAPDYFSEKFENAYLSVKNAFQSITTWFHEKWDSVKGVFKDVQTFFKDGFKKAYDAVIGIWNGLSGFFKDIAEDAFKPIKTLVNGVIKGVNWVLDLLGSGTSFKEWGGVKFAKGSDGLQKDTLGVVNDQPGSTYRELIVPPKGQPFIPKGRNVMLPLQKGTKIMPAGQTKALMDGTPHFAKGIGSFFGNAWESITKFTGNAMDYFDNPSKLVQIAFDKFIDTSRWTGAIGNVGVGVINTIFDSAVAFIKKIFGSNKIEQAVRWAIGIANDNSHGYDQAHRTGPDYDCSSLMTIALKKAGFNIGVGTTSTMLGQLLGIGFSDVTSSVNRGTGANMRRGDVLLKPGAHTAMYIGDGKIVHARINEFGGVTGGKTGDQTGDEIAVTPYHNHPWTYVLRYAKAYKNGIGRINLSDLIPAYSVGGFPEDGLFMANHNELVGQFSDGRTAVANNTDIQKGIEEAAYRGFARANAENTRQISLLEELIDAVREGKEIVVDGRSLTDAVDRRRSRNGYAFT